MIVLVGFMGAGKSAVGRLLAERLSLPFVDSDEVIERHAGAPIADIFERAGEAVFRSLESDVVAVILAGPDAVVALGGGALGDPVTLAAVERATVVELDVSLEDALSRTGRGRARPMLTLADPAALYSARRPQYRRVADVTVWTGGRSPEQVADEVAARLAEEPRRIPVQTGGGTYDVVVGPGAAARLGELMPPLPDAEKAFVVTHPVLSRHADNVRAALAGTRLACEVLTVADGERSKSLETAATVFEQLAASPAHRHDVVIGVGGGVVTDLAGFVASTYARGMAVVHVPTTLIGQVDAAIGGKTGVNLPHAKNLVGTFHQPRLVVCDVRLMEGLPEGELRTGLAEVVKYGFISDPSILETVERRAGDIIGRDEALLDEIVYRCAAIKAEVVSADEREAGRRAILNYGHTFAHAIEQASSYEGIRHGEAVALGMMAAAYLAHELDRIDAGVVALHRRVLEAAGLPVRAELDLDALHHAWLRDKKYRRGVRFVLLNSQGRPEVGVSAPPAAVAAALKRMAE